jgi:Mrp family chromosome partitioning ATPase
MTFKPANPCVVTFNSPDSPVTEQYRKLKTLILKMTRNEFRNTLLVTSSVGGEGKSVTCANLAVILAREYGQTVLLVDADLRKPALQEYLGLQSDFGLADCLHDRLDLGKAIVKTGLPSSRSCQRANRWQIRRAPFVVPDEGAPDGDEEPIPGPVHIIDTPPTLLYAETLALSALDDGIVVVVKEGVASLQGVRDTLDVLKGASLLGIVYNDVSNASLDGSYRTYKDHYKNIRSSDPVPDIR